MGAVPAIARIGRTADVVTLNPIMFTELTSAAVVTQLYDHLLELDAEFNYVALGLVKSWSISPEGDIVDFELRSGVRFHDGTELTAEDAAFTFQCALDPANQSPRRAQLIVSGQEMSFEAIDRYRLRIWLPSASASCLASIACLPLLPKHCYEGELMPEHRRNSSPVGSGSFRFGERKPGESVSILAYQGHYAGPPQLDRVDFLVYDGIESATKALLAGDVDYVPNVGTEIARSLEGQRGLSVSWSDAAMVTYLAFNLDAPPVRDLRVRSAIAHAIDRQGLVHEVMAGAAAVADTMVPPNTFWRNEDLIAPDYNIARASALLDAAGWRVTDSSGLRRNSARAPLELPILTTTGDRAKQRAAEFIAADLRRVGIDSSVHGYDMGTLLRDYIYPRQYKAALLALNPDPDPGFMNSFYHSAMLTPVGWNRCAYRNPVVDQLLEDSLSVTQDRRRRKAMLDEIQRIVAADLPHVTLYNPRLANVSSTRIHVPEQLLSHGDDFAVLRGWRVVS
ncbi:MAG TPA: ABC transporter substrate-binding protein [Trebonia sp.]|nr:ABC transporter substrate-binding protein [Trebonia sp.]